MKDNKICKTTILLNGKLHARVVNNILQEELVDKSEHSIDISLALSSPTISEDTHPTTSATDVGVTSTTVTLIVNSIAPNSNPVSPPHIQAMLHSLTLFHIMSTPQFLAQHVNDYHAGSSAAAFGTVVALPTN